MRGTTLANLRLMLRSEIGQTMQTTIATQGDAQLNQMLSNKQVWLSAMYDWPFLENRWDLTVPPAIRYLALPIDPNVPGTATYIINWDRPVLVEALWTRLWRPLMYGIGSSEYNTTNSDLGIQRDPIQRWQMATNVNDATASQIEVWPIPVTAQIIRFTGQRMLKPLYGNDANTADLDDLLLVNMVAADYLTFHKNPAASLKVSMARDRLSQLRSDLPKDDQRSIVLGRGSDKNRRNKRLLNIYVAGDTTGTGNSDGDGVVIGTG